MSTHNRESMVKSDFLSEEDFRGLKDATASLERIRSDGKADVERYLANPEGWASGKGSPSGLPTLLLTTIGRKSGEQRTTPLVFAHHGDSVAIVGSLAGYDQDPAWILNLRANPKCWLQLDHKKSAATAREASAEERKELWPKMDAVFPAYAYFQKQTERPFPFMIVTPTAPA